MLRRSAARAERGQRSAARRARTVNIREAFDIDDPPASIPWGIAESELQARLQAAGLRRVTRAYCVLPVTVLGGLQCFLGFRFRGPDNGLSELELYRTSQRNRRASFAEFQRHVEAVFGPPTSTLPGFGDFPNHEWQLPGGIQIVHHVLDRFGPEEHLTIRCTL